MQRCVSDPEAQDAPRRALDRGAVTAGCGPDQGLGGRTALPPRPGTGAGGSSPGLTAPGEELDVLPHPLARQLRVIVARSARPSEKVKDARAKGNTALVKPGAAGQPAAR